MSVCEGVHLSRIYTLVFDLYSKSVLNWKFADQKEKHLMLWQSQSIVSGLLLATRMSYSFCSTWFFVAPNKSGQQSIKSYFILLHSMPLGTWLYPILASVGFGIGAAGTLPPSHCQYDSQVARTFFMEVTHWIYLVIKLLHWYRCLQN